MTVRGECVNMYCVMMSCVDTLIAYTIIIMYVHDTIVVPCPAVQFINVHYFLVLRKFNVLLKISYSNCIHTYNIYL